MLRKFIRSKLFLGALACLVSTHGLTMEIAPQPFEIVISVAEQRLAVLREGGVVVKYPISTSKFGLGDSFGSYKTPLGHLRICDKVGDDLPSGTVIRNRTATGEVLAANAAGRDPIVTRILWLDGQDEQNRNARSRGIYIHGTTEEKRIGKPVSYGCIRMRSSDIIEMFAHLSVGTPVSIITTKLPKLRKYVPAPPAPPALPAPPVMLAGNAPVAPAKTPESSARPVSTGKPVSKPVGKARLSEVASGPSLVPADPGAAQALNGSILSAGLPENGAGKVGQAKPGKMTFHSWSAVSLRDAEASGRNAGAN